MKIAVHIPSKLAFSIKNYIDNIINNLDGKVELYRFTSPAEAHQLKNKVDIFWFPWLAGGSAPPLKVYQYISNKKLVVTLHGAAPFVIPPWFYYDSIKSFLKGEIAKFISSIKWFVYKNKASKIITVSKFAKCELERVFGFNPSKVIYIYHGIDTSIYNIQNSKFGNGNYILHVSQYQPKKNIDRIIKAYQLLREPKPELILIVPGYKKKAISGKIKLINTAKQSEELSYYYKNALVFIFPSLHETFGMPILEAMACGCPVITSNTTACSEIAGDAALLVDPYSVEDIAKALREIINNKHLRQELSKRGLERASLFSWKKSANEHLKVFEEVLKVK